MADSDVLKKYTERPYPTIEGGEAKYLIEELKKLSVATNLLVDVVKKLDAKQIAHGW